MLRFLTRACIEPIKRLLPTPNRDNGYDISDYYGVDSPHGTGGDIVELTNEARVRGIRVNMDLIINHTSDWLQEEAP